MRDWVVTAPSLFLLGLQVWLAIAIPELVDKLQVFILLLLLLHLPHLLLPHAVDYLQFLPLLDPFLVLVAFLH